MLFVLSDRSVKPDASALKFRYQYTEDENSPAEILLDAIQRRQSAMAYSTVLSRFHDVGHRSHIIEKSLWQSLSRSTQAKLYDLFDLNDQALKTISGIFECPPKHSKDLHNHCYPQPPCQSPSRLYANSFIENICTIPCVSNSTCPHPKSCLMGDKEGYCDSGLGSTAAAERNFHLDLMYLLLLTLIVLYLS